ncbi:glycerate kinase [Dysgonomonas sp. PFB1-18]|uniref:glycerate kinase family protein n=1 Tax=unclassified Dysgonomonas TaxID=2630389 RepID=UPI002473A619|nr:MULTISPECIES: glycerate kinase [unclassified Dysgonomonas]MDH6309954.1 glycerate kinase [Dysgonomonas sp. PF1-14]MDH6339864.1 glycerate kinase [Dysgonomonas sp. PF1-16]MDH6381512.1 glycerate kinase [Dysgonomonas sp. PFB1-18]MDH6398852.1 glycerate kinase [Dysgonomonas sp. PF1-23]
MRNPVFVLAPDSFKGSMTAKQACEAMERGIRRVLPTAECIKIPMADGGEGTMQSLVDATGGRLYELEVIGPLGVSVLAQYGILGNGNTAVIEMASASGIHLTDKNTRNPLIATTYGTGQLVKACLDKGIRKIILGIGGSATNDGGAGFAQALGVKFLNKEGVELPFGGAALSDLYKIDISSVDERLADTAIEVACDVTNPLCGEEGASFVFGPQKGATDAEMKILDEALYHYSHVIRGHLGKEVKDIPGAGAAGGLGAGLLAFTNARLEGGVDLVARYTGLHEAIKQADIVFTGEGAIDSQTRYGKTPYGVARIAKMKKKKVIAVAGCVLGDIGDFNDLGFDDIFSITSGGMSLEEAMDRAEENMEQVMEDVIRSFIMK